MSHIKKISLNIMLVLPITAQCDAVKRSESLLGVTSSPYVHDNMHT